MKKKRHINMSKRKGKAFWDKEYGTTPKHLAISTNPSEDLEKFMRWLIREFGETYVRSLRHVTDLGCGNGRNLAYLAGELHIEGVGYDISKEAIDLAKRNELLKDMHFEARSIAGDFAIETDTQDLVLDMMTSHFLKKDERDHMVTEIDRILKSGGWLFFKTFLLDEDKNAEKLLRDYPAEEHGSYIHPKIGVQEHVFTEQEIRELLEPYFIIHRVRRSHRHLARGRAAKRRSISVYAQKR
jgi:SAM-dependent methyltransferase